MKTNLLLLDSYNNIENLISFAFSFSKRSNRKLKIMYVFDFNWMRNTYLVAPTSSANADLYTVEKSVRKEFEVAKTKIRELVAEYMKHNTVKIPFEFDVSEENRLDVIRKEYENNKDLILMISNHQSYSDASDGAIGYPNIVESVNCPVFIIPDDIKKAVLKNIMYASDYNPEDITSLKHLYNFLVEQNGANITILHNERNYDFNERLKWVGFQETVRSVLRTEKVGFQLKTSKDFLSGVEDFVQQNNPDMLVMLKENKGFFEQVFSSNETKNVLTHFNKPVLVYHEE